MKKENLNIEKPNLRNIASNKTTRFMLPSISLLASKTSLKMLEYYGFVNCYIEHKQTYFYAPNYLYLVFNPDYKAVKTYKDFYEIYRTYPNYIRDYIIDFNLIVVVFSIKSKYIGAYKAFKESKYSSMTNEYASDSFKQYDIPSGKTIVHPQYLIINKSEEYRKHLEDTLDCRINPKAELLDRIDKREFLEYKIS